MKIDRVDLDSKETTWLVRNVVRTLVVLEAAAKKDPKVTERNTYRTLKAIEKTVLELEGDKKVETISINLPRKQKRIVSDMLELTLIALQDRIIPEYVRRGEDFKSYLEDAQAKAKILSGMLRKFR